ncbi:YjdJ family protein [Pseudalkalibacillus decolorationis]|uniref:YjdJ family protein n=1 Tax=Pseudalkalibacillus decolorationis TaxID=163879 RepID=UPI0021498379|nr:YjdJ family protein [Pseudalkalibacillus decolorationis]
MSVRYLTQMGLAVLLLFLSTFGAWYEGSELLGDPWEWKYSTPFSKMVNGEVNGTSDITELDFFVYSAKFNPVFPVLMVISLVYLTFLSGYKLLRSNHIKLSVFCSGLGILLLIVSGLISNSPTNGGKALTTTFIVCGILSFTFASSFYFRMFKRQGKEVY